ncbi:MAG: sulfotransferase family protein [Gammaproteobacteria bacterium]|nr:sulfotransferase family protein [Gammaproteobacteria bacterium]
MLISDSHEFIFVRVRKTASQSMWTALEPYVLPRPAGRWARFKSRAGLERDYRKYRFRAHEKITTAKRLLPPERFERYFKFAIVRNPWHRLVSEYEFILKSPNHGRHRRVKALDGFASFIEMQIPRRDAYQVNQLCDSNGDLLMDFVGKLENLDDDWETICWRIGIPHVALPRKNVSVKRPYTDYYTPETRDLVARRWSREIELFGYTFD